MRAHHLTGARLPEYRLRVLEAECSAKEVVGCARHSETLEELVVYRALYGEQALWVRPLEMFLGDVERDGKPIPRFTWIG